MKDSSVKPCILQVHLWGENLKTDGEAVWILGHRRCGVSSTRKLRGGHCSLNVILQYPTLESRPKLITLVSGHFGFCMWGSSNKASCWKKTGASPDKEATLMLPLGLRPPRLSVLYTLITPWYFCCSNRNRLRKEVDKPYKWTSPIQKSEIKKVTVQILCSFCIV